MTATGVVALVVTISKFALGAWMVLVLIPLLAAMMWAIQRHYRHVQDILTAEWPDAIGAGTGPPDVIVPVSRLDARPFGRSTSPAPSRRTLQPSM